MTQYLDWKVGDRVVFVGPAKRVSIARSGLMGFLFGKKRLHHSLEADATYTIKGIGSHFELNRHERLVCVLLVEACFSGSPTTGFPAEWFRKVQPRKTSIAIFERLLNTQNNEVETA